MASQPSGGQPQGTVTTKSPSEFIKNALGSSVVVKLNSGVVYKGNIGERSWRNSDKKVFWRVWMDI
jgi:hypothetical protein